MAAMQYIHANGVIVCDLKPSNVLIDEHGALKLCDLGLAQEFPTDRLRNWIVENVSLIKVLEIMWRHGSGFIGIQQSQHAEKLHNYAQTYSQI